MTNWARDIKIKKKFSQVKKSLIGLWKCPKQKSAELLKIREKIQEIPEPLHRSKQQRKGKRNNKYS